MTTFEINSEFRYDIARIIPNTLTLRGAIFSDIGNVWNTRNSKSDGSTDTSQFQFKNMYKQTKLLINEEYFFSPFGAFLTL